MSARRRIAGAGAAAVAVSAVAVAGCGGGSSGSSAATAASAGGKAAATTLKVTADPTGKLRFSPATLRAAKTGTLTLVMTNPGSTKLMHGIAVQGNGVDKDGPIVGPGKTSRVTVALKKAGTYTFYCPFDGHKAAGMKGTLTVGKARGGAPPTTKTSPSRPGY